MLNQFESRLELCKHNLLAHFTELENTAVVYSHLNQAKRDIAAEFPKFMLWGPVLIPQGGAIDIMDVQSHQLLETVIVPVSKYVQESAGW